MSTVQTPATGIQYTPPPPAAPGGEWGDRPGGGARRRASFTALLCLLAAVTLLFAAFTSTLVIRSGVGGDWSGIPAPGVLWWNTLVILASSAWLELARRSLRLGERRSFNRFWTAGTALGLAFLAGQAAAWWQLRAAGVYVASSPGSAFFYVFTVAHAVHVLGGIGALGYIEWQAIGLRLGPAKRTAVEIAAYYWHFLAVLWIYLMLLFQFWG
jgi:cytochrome c oxidase subunit 3